MKDNIKILKYIVYLSIIIGIASTRPNNDNNNITIELEIKKPKYESVCTIKSSLSDEFTVVLIPDKSLDELPVLNNTYLYNINDKENPIENIICSDGSDFDYPSKFVCIIDSSILDEGTYFLKSNGSYIEGELEVKAFDLEAYPFGITNTNYNNLLPISSPIDIHLSTIITSDSFELSFNNEFTNSSEIPNVLIDNTTLSCEIISYNKKNIICQIDNSNLEIEKGEVSTICGINEAFEINVITDEPRNQVKITKANIEKSCDNFPLDANISFNLEYESLDPDVEVDNFDPNSCIKISSSDGSEILHVTCDPEQSTASKVFCTSFPPTISSQYYRIFVEPNCQNDNNDTIIRYYNQDNFVINKQNHVEPLSNEFNQTYDYINYSEDPYFTIEYASDLDENDHPSATLNDTTLSCNVDTDNTKKLKCVFSKTDFPGDSDNYQNPKNYKGYMTSICGEQDVQITIIIYDTSAVPVMTMSSPVFETDNFCHTIIDEDTVSFSISVSFSTPLTENGESFNMTLINDDASNIINVLCPNPQGKSSITCTTTSLDISEFNEGRYLPKLENKLYLSKFIINEFTAATTDEGIYLTTKKYAELDYDSDQTIKIYFNDGEESSDFTINFKGEIDSQYLPEVSAIYNDTTYKNLTCQVYESKYLKCIVNTSDFDFNTEYQLKIINVCNEEESDVTLKIKLLNIASITISNPKVLNGNNDCVALGKNDIINLDYDNKEKITSEIQFGGADEVYLENVDNSSIKISLICTVTSTEFKCELNDLPDNGKYIFNLPNDLSFLDNTIVIKHAKFSDSVIYINANHINFININTDNIDYRDGFVQNIFLTFEKSLSETTKPSSIYLVNINDETQTELTECEIYSTDNTKIKCTIDSKEIIINENDVKNYTFYVKEICQNNLKISTFTIKNTGSPIILVSKTNFGNEYQCNNLQKGTKFTIDFATKPTFMTKEVDYSGLKLSLDSSSYELSTNCKISNELFTCETTENMQTVPEAFGNYKAVISEENSTIKDSDDNEIARIYPYTSTEYINANSNYISLDTEKTEKNQSHDYSTSITGKLIIKFSKEISTESSVKVYLESNKAVFNCNKATDDEYTLICKYTQSLVGINETSPSSELVHTVKIENSCGINYDFTINLSVKKSGGDPETIKIIPSSTEFIDYIPNKCNKYTGQLNYKIKYTSTSSLEKINLIAPSTKIFLNDTSLTESFSIPGECTIDKANSLFQCQINKKTIENYGPYYAHLDEYKNTEENYQINSYNSQENIYLTDKDYNPCSHDKTVKIECDYKKYSNCTSKISFTNNLTDLPTIVINNITLDCEVDKNQNVLDCLITKEDFPLDDEQLISGKQVYYGYIINTCNQKELDVELTVFKYDKNLTNTTLIVVICIICILCILLVVVFICRCRKREKISNDVLHLSVTGEDNLLYV